MWDVNFFFLFEELGSKTSDNIYRWCRHAFHSIQSTEYSKAIPREREYVCLLLLLARIRNSNTFIEEEKVHSAFMTQFMQTKVNE